MAIYKSGLEHLFGSDTRLKLLRIFLHNPAESYYVRELVRRVGTQIHAIRRELLNLEKLGLIQAVEAPPNDPTAHDMKGPLSQRKYYTVEAKHLLFPELKSLIVKADLLAREDLVDRLKETGAISLLILAGRFVGVAHTSTDLLMVGTINKKILKEVLTACEREFGHEINFTVLTPKEYKYRKEITDRFLYEILEGKKVVLIDTGVDDAV